MNLFLCALRPTGQPVQKSDLFGFLARLPRDVEYETVIEGSFAAVAATGSATLRPLIGRYRHLIGVGDVRLDNRADVLRLSGGGCETDSDLQLVLAAIDQHGAAAVKSLEGDFSFVAWDARGQKVIAARDAFGVKPLFLRRDPGILLFSSRSAPLSRDQYDTSYLRDFLLGMPTQDTRTVWQQVQRLDAGTILEQRGTGDRLERYWSADQFKFATDADETESVGEFRRLFSNAVAQRLDGNRTWAQLSGGLDSSAVVSTAERCVGTGSIAGTITLVESLGNGDERAFAQAVTSQHGLRNVQIEDSWPWQNSSLLQPTDEPNALFPFQYRDQQMRDVVRSNGGRVLLSGLGSDHYLFGNLSYIPDLVATGHLVRAARELTVWSIALRQSFWSMAQRYALSPLFKRQASLSALASPTAAPAWLGNEKVVAQDFARLYGFMAQAPRGRLFAHYTARELGNIPAWVMRDGFEHGLEVRYPFLSRPLVEFALRLPVHMRVRPHARKWVLREAMRGILPEQVRTRSTKAGIDARILWALEHEKPLLTRLLHDSILADLGLVDGAALRTAVEEARCGQPHNSVLLMSALSLETWLSVRDGRLAVQRKAA